MYLISNYHFHLENIILDANILYSVCDAPGNQKFAEKQFKESFRQREKRLVTKNRHYMKGRK